MQVISSVLHESNKQTNNCTSFKKKNIEKHFQFLFPHQMCIAKNKLGTGTYLLLAFLLLSPVMVRELDVDLDALAGGLALARRLLLLLCR
jgi:hypothetical protein